MNKIAILYWMHLPDHTDPLTQGYIGVSIRFETRVQDHYKSIQTGTHKNPHLVNAVKKYGWDNIIKEAIYTGDESSCYQLEETYRSTSAIGWNIAPGGHKGPGRPKGQSPNPNALLKRKETIRLRNERILAGNLTDSDLSYMDRKKERHQLIEEKKKTKLKEKQKRNQQKIDDKVKLRTIRELQRQQKIENKVKNSEVKSRSRTSGVVLTRQPSRSLCGNCKVSPVKPNGTSKNGFKKWHKYCASCAKAAYDKKFGYLLDKKNVCEQCGFIPQDKCQLDRIYLDGNTKNKLTANIKTLCANCNRIYQKKLKESSSSIMDITVDADILI